MPTVHLNGLFRPGPPGAPVVALTSAQVEAELGLIGDRHARAGSLRQLLLVDRALLDQFGLQPGDLGENLTLTGLDLQTLARGQRLRVGSIWLEITIPCPPCGKLEAIRLGLRDALREQRGIFARVLTSGTLHLGDPIVIEQPALGSAEH